MWRRLSVYYLTFYKRSIFIISCAFPHDKNNLKGSLLFVFSCIYVFFAFASPCASSGNFTVTYTLKSHLLGATIGMCAASPSVLTCPYWISLDYPCGSHLGGLLRKRNIQRGNCDYVAWHLPELPHGGHNLWHRNKGTSIQLVSWPLLINLSYPAPQAQLTCHSVIFNRSVIFVCIKISFAIFVIIEDTKLRSFHFIKKFYL